VTAVARAERAPAKVNLTLRVVAPRADGYHDIESLVMFADVGDTLTLTPGPRLSLSLRGPTAAAAGATADNLVLKAANALARRVDGLGLGRFSLTKRLPVAAGLGGGSADAAAALRLLARANRLEADDPRLMQAAQASGADVPVCLDSRPRLMRGTGDVLSEPLALPRLSTVLVNPGVAVPTKDVFVALRRQREEKSRRSRGCNTAHLPGLAFRGRLKMADFVARLAECGNDLEAPAIEIAPVIADVLRELRSLGGCRLARMSGSGATCFALFGSQSAAAAAARMLRARHRNWWVHPTTLG
jgi:4-diphosphocytidyl-2-C-methyl-D-erythritol kinase